MDDEIYQLSTNHNRHLQQYFSNTSNSTIHNLLRGLVHLLLHDDISLIHKSWSEKLQLVASNCRLILANDSTKFDALTCVHLNIAAVLFSRIDFETALKILLPVIQRSLSSALQDQPLIEICSCKLFFQILLSMGVQFNRLQSTSYMHEYFSTVDSLQKKFLSVGSNFDVTKKSISFIQNATINIKGIIIKRLSSKFNCHCLFLIINYSIYRMYSLAYDRLSKCRERVHDSKRD